MTDSFETDSEAYYTTPFLETSHCSKSLPPIPKTSTPKNPKQTFPPIPSHPISTILKPQKTNYPKAKNFETKTLSFKTLSFERISSRANSEDNILQNSVNKQSISYLRELCVIELSRLKIPNFQNFLNTKNEEQLIEFHEMIRKIKKKNKRSCLIM